MTVAANLANICEVAKPLIEQRLGLDDQLNELRNLAADEGLSWIIIRTILVAEAKDARDGGDRLSKLTEKTSLATDYLALLGFAASATNLNEPKTSPHDTTNGDAVSPQSVKPNVPIAGLSAALPADLSIPPNLRR